MKVKEKSEKVGFKLNIQETKIMISGPITSWWTDGETMGTMREFIFLDSKITADGDFSHEIKRCLLLGRKVMTNPRQHVKKQRHSLPTKVCLVKAMVFPLVMCGCESWTIRKGEHWRIDGFELWCWKRLLRSLGLQGDPTSQSSRKWVLNIHRKDWCWSWSSILWSPAAKSQLIGKDPDAWEGLGQKEKGATEDEMVGWHYWVNGHEFEQAQGVSDGQGSLACCSPWGRKELDLTEWLNWTEPLINSLKLENLKLFLLSLYKSLT